MKINKPALIIVLNALLMVAVIVLLYGAFKPSPEIIGWTTQLSQKF